MSRVERRWKAVADPGVEGDILAHLPVDDFALDPADGVAGEAGPAQHFAQQLQGRCPDSFVAEAAQGEKTMVAVDAIADLHPQAVERGQDRVDILTLRPFVEQAQGHGRQAGLLAVVTAARGKAHGHIEQRQAMGFNEEHLGSAEGFPAADNAGSGGGCQMLDLAQGLQGIDGRQFDAGSRAGKAGEQCRQDTR